jgi:hypothetical protein
MSVRFIGCTNLKDLSALAGLKPLKKLLFGSCHGIFGIPSLPKLISVSMRSTVFAKELFAWFASLQRVSVSGHFPDNAEEAFKTMIHTEEICLQNFSKLVFPQLPVLHGKMMLIYGFNLSDWNRKELPNTEWLKFRDCTALGDLPKAHTLTIYNCPTLRTTGKMPLLRKWIVRVADNLQVVIPSNSLQLLAFEQLRTTVDVSKFASVPKLSFYFNQQLHNVFGLGCQNSEVKLIGCRSVLDFTPLKNIYKVHIGETPMLVHGRDICNITHLTIDDCPNFVDTTGLGKVKSLKIYNCSKLRSLSELQTISRVVILNCDNVEDYSVHSNCSIEEIIWRISQGRKTQGHFQND